MANRRSARVPAAMVTNGLLRKSLAVTRSLGRHGIDVVVGEAAAMNPSSWSKYCKSRVSYPHPTRDRDGFLEWLRHQAEQGMVLFPMDDDVMDAIMDRPERLPTAAHWLIPHPDVYHTMRDKLAAVQVAAQYGLRCPASWPSTDISAFAQESALDTFPLVIRPRRSSGSRGLQVIRSPEALKEGTLEGRWPIQEVFLQEYIPPGERIDVCLLLNRESRCVAGFVQRETRHFPIPYGPSTAQESVQDEALLLQCARMAEEIRWQGVIEFEWMRRESDGRLYFMEANTRFWNSLQCAVDAGVDFPWLYYELSLGHAVETVFSYPSGIRCSSRLPLDTLNRLQSMLLRNRPDPVQRHRGERDDILSWRDIWPAVGYLVALIRLAGRRETWRDVFNRGE